MKKIYNKIFKALGITGSVNRSLSDNFLYPQVCLSASNDYRVFRKFRRNKDYTKILEHVTKDFGSDYLQIISRDSDIMASMDNFKLNDDYGSPKMYNYPQIGLVSPTTLRYIKVLSDLKKYFKTLDNLNIVEIGIGYGGQCRVINAYYKPVTYCLVDILPALSLAQKFLDNYILHSALFFKMMNELHIVEYDLVISNYAFTELPRDIQDVYLKRVILNSKRGYITYNEITPPHFKSYTSDELVALIPGSRILKEEPLTYSKNCIIVWGENP